MVAKPPPYMEMITAVTTMKRTGGRGFASRNEAIQDRSENEIETVDKLAAGEVGGGRPEEPPAMLARDSNPTKPAAAPG